MSTARARRDAPRYLEPAVAGDSGDFRLVELDGVTTIAGATIVSYVWRHGVARVALTTSIHNVGDTLTDPDDKPVIRVELGTWLQSTAVPGHTYMVEYEVNLGGGQIPTWPANTPDRLEVRRRST